MPSTDNATDCGPKTINPSATLTPAQRRVAAALAEVHQATASELNALAGVSKSSTAKTLGTLEDGKAAIRTIRESDGIPGRLTCGLPVRLWARCFRFEHRLAISAR